MDAERIAMAKACLDAAHDGSLGFPGIIDKLMGAGFEGYAVDYRRNRHVYYLPNGDNVEFATPDAAGSVAGAFDKDRVEALVRWAQANGPVIVIQPSARRRRAQAARATWSPSSTVASSITVAPARPMSSCSRNEPRRIMVGLAAWMGLAHQCQARCSAITRPRYVSSDRPSKAVRHSAAPGGKRRPIKLQQTHLARIACANCRPIGTI